MAWLWGAALKWLSCQSGLCQPLAGLVGGGVGKASFLSHGAPARPARVVQGGGSCTLWLSSPPSWALGGRKVFVLVSVIAGGGGPGREVWRLSWVISSSCCWEVKQNCFACSLQVHPVMRCLWELACAQPA